MLFTIDIRVRYQETDAQGRLHHANYINYFEVARVEMLRAGGFSYRELEESGVMLVVAEVGCHYHQAARYDDLLRVETTVGWARGVRIRHDYRVNRVDLASGQTELMAEGHTVVASVNREGKVIRLPEWLRNFKLASEG